MQLPDQRIESAGPRRFNRAAHAGRPSLVAGEYRVQTLTASSISSASAA